MLFFAIFNVILNFLETLQNIYKTYIKLKIYCSQLKILKKYNFHQAT